VGAEPKYDGLRLQVHKDDSTVMIFSRRLEDLTEMFPEVIRATMQQVKAHRAIFEGEAIVFHPETGEYRPFQITVQRKRKYGIEEMSARYPLRLFTFDLLYVDGEDLTPRPLRERRAKLEAVLPFSTDSTLSIAEQLQTSSVAELESFFLAMIEHGLEGIVAKRLDAAYHAGARNFNWVKLKRAYQEKLRDTVDVVLVGYLVGRGHRARFGIGSLLGAVYDKAGDCFKTVAKIGSGLSEEQWAEMKNRLDKIAVDHCPARVDSLLVPDIWVEPTYVVEVQADEITRSPVHTAGRVGNEPGYALRFPRMIDWIREDKAPEDATSVDEILEMYRMQSQH
jgi:DNA ligase-1